MAYTGPRRAAVLNDGCPGDPSLRQEVESLLAAHDQASSFIESPAFEVHQPQSEVDEALPPGMRMGGYTLHRVLGRGGMGLVYQAEQEQPRRLVALKLIRPGLASSAMLRRFQHEAQILARLQHSGIAQIFEAGVQRIESPFGQVSQPYFAMELVFGRPLTSYVAAVDASPIARLELFIKVCDAVQHAHQKGVIHRDLKPGNILVSDQGVPKVLDFGVARDADAGPDTAAATQAGQLLGTMAYMSPEQARGEPVDVRSDVYALGVILYELVTGRPPLELAGLPLPEAARRICNDPPRPPRALDRHIDADIETIVLKALEKQPERRYDSVASLGLDVTRYLAHQPILARPPSVAYQLRKLVRRHRALSAALLAAAVCLMAGTVTTTWLWLEARAAAKLATREKTHKEFINEFLLDAFQSAAPEKAGHQLTVRALLDRAAARIRTAPPPDPLIEADLHVTVGKAYKALSLHESARPHFERAVVLREQSLGQADAGVLDAQRLALAALTEGGGREAGIAGLHAHLDRCRAVLGDEHPVTMATWMDRLRLTPVPPDAIGYSQRQEERRAVLRAFLQQTTAIWEYYCRTLGPSSDEALAARRQLAQLHSEAYDFKQAVPIARELVEQWRARGEADPRNRAALADALGLLAHLLGRAERTDEVDAPLSEAIRIDSELHGPDHALTMLRRGLRAQLLIDRLPPGEAEAELRAALVAARGFFGENHHETVTMMIGLGMVLERRGGVAEAFRLYRQADEVCRVVDGPLSRGRMQTFFRSRRTLPLEVRMALIVDEAARIVQNGEATAADVLREFLGFMSNVGTWPVVFELTACAFDPTSGFPEIEPARATAVIADVVEVLAERTDFESFSHHCSRLLAIAAEYAGDDAALNARLATLADRCRDAARLDDADLRPDADPAAAP